MGFFTRESFKHFTSEIISTWKQFPAMPNLAAMPAGKARHGFDLIFLGFSVRGLRALSS